MRLERLERDVRECRDEVRLQGARVHAALAYFCARAGRTSVFLQHAPPFFQQVA